MNRFDNQKQTRKQEETKMSEINKNRRGVHENFAIMLRDETE